MSFLREVAFLLLVAPFVVGQPKSARLLPQRIVEGDMLVRPDSAFTASTPTHLWPDGVVVYLMDDDIPNPERMTNAFDYYTQNTPIRFRKYSAEANYVHIVRNPVGSGVCASNVGMIGGEQFIHVDDVCSTSNLIHEIGHALGFYHEQSRIDRNRFVTVLYENVNKAALFNFPAGSSVFTQDLGPYDYASHMHYSPYSFSTGGSTIQTVPAGIPLNTYPVLSPGDLDTLFREYGQTPTRTTLVTNPPGLQLILDGQPVASPQVLDWAANATHTLSVADQSIGNTRFRFGTWSDGGAATHTITSNPDVTLYSANLIQEVSVKVLVAASGGGRVTLDSSSADEYFASQTQLMMTATPDPGYTFLSWSGGTSCPLANAASPARIETGSTAIVCMASFTQSPVTTILTKPADLPVKIDGFSYTQTPVNLVWTPGSTHSISTSAPATTATSPARYVFHSWDDGGAVTHTITAGSARTITATYDTQYSLVTGSSASAYTVSPPATNNFYAEGTTVEITALPKSGDVFFAWAGDPAGQPNPATLTMDSQKYFDLYSFKQSLPGFSVVNAATFAFSPLPSGAAFWVAPGEIVTLFGAGVGPGTPVTAQLDANGRLASTIGDTKVTFNGIPAPIVAASANQTSVIVPYGISITGTVQIKVSAAGKTSTLNVAGVPVAPGLFTARASGSGQAAAANQDGSVNTPLNPAPKGSIVTFYATGAGQLLPAGVDGEIIGAALPKLTQPVSLRIGGKPAEIAYAGPAPGEVSGVLQVNAKVPADAPSGETVSVYLVIGDASTPQGVTIAVK